MAKNVLSLVFLIPLTGFNQNLETYKDKGPIKSIYYSCTAGEFNKKEKLTYEYDSDGSCNNDVVEMYDESGNLIFRETTRLNDDSSTWRSFIKYEYAMGKVSSGEAMILPGSGDTLNYYITYFHSNDSGLETDSSFGRNHKFLQAITRQYDAVARTETRNFSDRSGKLIASTITYFDEKGQIMRSTELVSEGIAVTETNVCHYIYSENSEKIYVVVSGDTLNWQYSECNESGQVITEQFTDLTNDPVMDGTVYTYRYTYDTYGNWVEKRFYTDDVLYAIERRRIVYREG